MVASKKDVFASLFLLTFTLKTKMDNETFDPDGRKIGKENVKNTINSKIHYVDFSKSKDASKEAQIKRSQDLKKAKGLASIRSVIANLKPCVPIYFVRPHSLKRAASWFLDNFSDLKNGAGKKHRSEVLYSVKSNPDEKALQCLFDAGLRHFDVASLNEIRLIKRLFGDKVKMYFMHPVKSREAIIEAYFSHNIRDFSLDSADELKKILDVTNNAKDLGLHLRMAIPNSHSAIDLSGKFGIRPTESVTLVRKIRGAAKRFGMCFHVGSQCMDPTQYRAAMMIVKEVLKKAKVKLDVLDIGGGFPSVYPAMMPPSMQSYIDEIRDSIAEMNLDEDCMIWCEPGRALVAESNSLLVRVEGRKDNMLYINDGTYGGLFDAGFPAFIYPVQATRVKRGAALMQELAAFGFYGPTCDSLDAMKGPFYLPRNINEGDYIEIGQLGAYSKSIRTDFNGFSDTMQIEVKDEPLASLYLSEEGLEEQSKNQ